MELLRSLASFVGRARRGAARLDAVVSSVLARRRVVLVDAAIPMHFAILAPVFQRLQVDPRVHVLFSSAQDVPPGVAASATGAVRPAPRGRMLWRRIDVCLDADPVTRTTLNRCRRRATFQQGLAGRFELDDHERMRATLAPYDRVAFINGATLGRYVEDRIVPAERAALVGYPKVDALVNGRYDASAVHTQLQLEMHRPTAIYAPTWSAGSSLPIAGEGIVRSLLESGFNVIVKLHDRSLATPERPEPERVDWRARFARIHQPGRVAFVEAADSSPYLAASDVMVTDYSSIGFEFCLLDRAIVLFDTPLAQPAQVNPERIERLRRATRVIDRAEEAGPVALAEMANQQHQSHARRELARELFYEPGTATARALAVVYTLLDLPARTLAQAVPGHVNNASARSV